MYNNVVLKYPHHSNACDKHSLVQNAFHMLFLEHKMHFQNTVLANTTNT